MARKPCLDKTTKLIYKYQELEFKKLIERINEMKVKPVNLPKPGFIAEVNAWNNYHESSEVKEFQKHINNIVSEIKELMEAK